MEVACGAYLRHDRDAGTPDGVSPAPGGEVMASNMRRRLVALGVAAFSALTVLAVTAAAAVATVPSGLVDGQGMNIGRGGIFRVTPPTDWSTAAILGGLAISVVVVALVAWLGIRSDSRSRAVPALAASESSLGAARPVHTEEHERKAA